MGLLRSVLLVVASAMVLAGVGLLIAVPKGPGVALLVFGMVLLLGTVFERWRYRPPAAPAGAQWQRTGERFEDPKTGRIVEVLYDPRSGQRRYAGADEQHDGQQPG